MNEELMKRIDLIQSLIKNGTPEDLEETVKAFKEMISLDTDHEIKADYFLTLYQGAVRKYRRPFENEIIPAIRTTGKHVAEYRFINVCEIIEHGMDLNGKEYIGEARSTAAAKGFGELLNTKGPKANFPYKAAASLMGMILKNYKDQGYNIEEKLKDAIKDTEYGKPLKDWSEANKIQKEIDKSNSRNEYDDYAYKLTELKRQNDSDEYNAIITELESLRDHPFSVLGTDGFLAKGYNGLTVNQMKAIPYIRVYAKIEEYLQHKADDGVNVNAYDKLDAVEQLRQFVDKKIDELNPGEFQYPDPKNSEEKITFDLNQAREVYSRNYSSLKRTQAPAEQQNQQNPQENQNLEENQAPQGNQNQQKVKKELPPVKKAEFKANEDYIDSLPKKIKHQLSKYSPDDLRERMKSDPDDLMYELMQEATIPKQDLDDEYVRNMINDMIPGYKIPGKEIMDKREKQREQYGQKLYQSLLKKQILLRIYGLEGEELSREGKTYFDYTGKSNNPEESDKLTEEFLYHNSHQINKPSSKDPKVQEEYQKKNAEYRAKSEEITLRQLKAFNSFNLTKIDPLDPKSILDNAEEAFFIASFGYEMEKVIAPLRNKRPEFLARPEVLKFEQRAPQMYEYAQSLKQTMEMMMNPLYNYLGIFDDPKSMSIDFERQVEGKEGPQSLNEKYYYSGDIYSKSPYTQKYLAYYIGTSNYIGSGSLSPYMDRTLTMKERAAKVSEQKKLIIHKFAAPQDPERKTGTAEPDSFKETLDIPKFTNPETETLLNLLAEGEPGAGRSGYDYTNREYYARTYVKDENNVFVPAFPDAGKSEWKGPTEEELYKLAHSDKNFGYFSEGSDDFFLIRGKSSLPASKETEPILFGEDAKRRVLKKFSPDEAIRYQNERRIKDLKDNLNGFERVRTIATSILGSKMENRGNGTELSFEQRFNKYFSDQPGTVYPTADSDRQLREDDIAALTMLNITSPKISGSLHPGSEPEVNVLSTFNMSLSDLFIQRSEPTISYWQPAVTARQDLAKSLKEYYSSGDMTGLATTIADGFHCMAESCQNRSELTGKSASQSIPLVMTMEMLKRGSNKQLLEKTKEIISARGKDALDTFEKDWKKAETLCQLYDDRKKAFESELKLLRYENGQLTDDQGNTLTPTDKEREQLQTDVNRSNFLSELGMIHNDFCHNRIPKETMERMVSEMIANTNLAKEILEAKKKETGADYTFDDFMKKRDELNAVPQQRVDNEQTLMPISPVYTVLLEHPQGKRVLDAMLKETPKTKELYQRLEDEGLIPPNGGLDGYDKESYDETIGLYSEWLDAEPQFKKDWETNKDFFQEQGLEYDDVVTLKKAGHIKSIESYRKAIEDAEKEAAVKFADQGGLPKEEQLNAIKDMLSEGLSEKLTAADLCGAFKTINTLSKENEKDPLTVYVASQLMTKVCVKLNDYMSESPEKLMEVREFLKKDDYEKAAYTINRGDAVKKEVEEKIQSRNNEGMSKNGNTKQHVFNK